MPQKRKKNICKFNPLPKKKTTTGGSPDTCCYMTAPQEVKTMEKPNASGSTF